MPTQGSIQSSYVPPQYGSIDSTSGPGSASLVSNLGGAGAGIDANKLADGVNFNARDWDGGTYSEEWHTGENARAKRTMICAWSEYRTWKQYLLGWSNNNNGTLTRVVPAQHPAEPSLYCTGVNLVKGLGGIVYDPTCYARDENGQLISDGNGPIRIPFLYYIDSSCNVPKDGAAVVEVHYSQLPYRVLSDSQLSDAASGSSQPAEMFRYVERQQSFGVQAQQLPSTLVAKFTSGNYSTQSVPGNPVRILPFKQLTWRWVEVPDVPQVAIANCIGKVNQSPFDIPPYGPYNADTLLLQNPKVRWYWNAVGRIVWEITYIADFKPDGWNSALAPDGKFYPYALYDTNNNQVGKTFPSADFSQLFEIPQPGQY